MLNVSPGLLLIPLFLIVQRVTHAQTILLRSFDEKILLNEKAKAFEDNTGALTIAQVSRSEGLVRFKGVGNVKPSFIKSTYWLSFSISSQIQSKVAILVDQSITELVELYSWDTLSGWRVQRSGFVVPKSGMETSAETPVFELAINAQPEIFFLKIVSNALPPVYITSSKHFHEGYGALKRTITGIVLGAILLNSFLSLVQFFQYRRRIYLLYFAALLTIAVYIMIAYGLVAFLTPVIYERLLDYTLLASALSQYLILLFGIRLLEIRKGDGILSTFTWWYSYVLLAVTFCSLSAFLVTGASAYMINIVIGTAILLCFVCVVNGVLSVSAGRIIKNVAVVYTLSYVFLAAFTILEFLHLSFGLPKFLAVNNILMGFLAETIGIGIALNLKTKMELDIAQFTLTQAQHDKLRILKEANATLEDQVQQRTTVLRKTVSELDRTNKQLVEALGQSERLKEELLIKTNELEATNNWKTRLIGIISHDLMSPLNSLTGLFKLLRLNYLSQADFDKAKEQLESTLNNLVSSLTGILKWVESQMTGAKVNQSAFLIRPVVQSIIDLLRQTADGKEISLENGTDEKLHLLADKNHVEVVLRNLVSNAIKFSHRNSTIRIGSYCDHGHGIIQVIDQGIGLENADPFLTNTRSRAGTNKEKGIGFGLIVCKELIEKNNGKIWAFNNDDKGSSFCFSLPIRFLGEDSRG